MIEKEFNEICQFRQDNPPIPGEILRTNSPIVQSVFSSLDSLRNKLKEKFSGYRGINFTFEYSRGAANFPNILHTSILPPGQKVSNGIYVVICFDKLGNGALVGCAKSATNPQDLDTEIRKTSNKDLLSIDVDGHSKNTQYNNTYANPKEIFYKLTDDTEVLTHIERSLDLVLYKLGLIKGRDLNINQLVSSQNLSIPFDPKNIEDGRKKIAIQINARQGQPTFRKKLLEAYDAKCAISGCKIQSILEAAHIIPYKGSETHHVQNGILLRADLHTLFDLNLIEIDPETFNVRVEETIRDSEYQKFHNQQIYLPKRRELYPHKDALKYRLTKKYNSSEV